MKEEKRKEILRRIDSITRDVRRCPRCFDAPDIVSEALEFLLGREANRLREPDVIGRSAKPGSLTFSEWESLAHTLFRQFSGTLDIIAGGRLTYIGDHDVRTVQFNEKDYQRLCDFRDFVNKKLGLGVVPLKRNRDEVATPVPEKPGPKASAVLLALGIMERAKAALDAVHQLSRTPSMTCVYCGAKGKGGHSGDCPIPAAYIIVEAEIEGWLIESESEDLLGPEKVDTSLPKPPPTTFTMPVDDAARFIQTSILEKVGYFDRNRIRFIPSQDDRFERDGKLGELSYELEEEEVEILQKWEERQRR